MKSQCSYGAMLERVQCTCRAIPSYPFRSQCGFRAFSDGHLAPGASRAPLRNDFGADLAHSAVPVQFQCIYRAIFNFGWSNLDLMQFQSSSSALTGQF